jgi:hypothetical protein
MYCTNLLLWGAAVDSCTGFPRDAEGFIRGRQSWIPRTNAFHREQRTKSGIYLPGPLGLFLPTGQDLTCEELDVDDVLPVNRNHHQANRHLSPQGTKYVFVPWPTTERR